MSIEIAEDKQDYAGPISKQGVVVIEVYKVSGRASPAVSAYMKQWSAHANSAITFLRVPLELAMADPDTFDGLASAPAVCYFKGGKCVLQVLGNYVNSNYTLRTDPAQGWYEKKLADVLRG
ncbi:hypothetical protein ACSMEV_06105 [Pseudomonas sp. MLB6B]